MEKVGGALKEVTSPESLSSWNFTERSQFLSTFKVARVVEIFKMLYFIIFLGKAIIYFKYWYTSIEKDFCRQEYLKKTLLFILFTVKIFFEKVSCKVLL